jgi:hypothetical protein
MAEPTPAPTAHRASVLDALPSRPEREIAAQRAALAAATDLHTAVDFLERIYLRASTTKYAYGLKRWIDPEITDREYIAARDSVISDVIQAGPESIEGLNAKRAYYRQQIERFVPAVGQAARTWTLANLNRQTQTIFQLLITTKPRVYELHKAARAVRATVDADNFVLQTMTGDEAREATGEIRAGEKRTAGTIGERLRRLFYTYVLRKGPRVAPGAKPSGSDVDAYDNLLTLMNHPRGVEIVDAFARSPEKGWQLTTELFSDSLKAIVELQGNLVSDHDLVWRFPPAVVAGIASLGLKNRAGITQFALAWGASRKTPLEKGLEIAGNALFVLDLVGGPLGAAVSDVIGFVLDVIGTAISFLRDVEQDQAAASTAFAARSERLSHGSNKLGTVLQGVAAVVSGFAVPGALRKIVGSRTKEVVRVVRPTERVVPMRDLPDPRAVTDNKGLRTTVTELDRGAARPATGTSREITPAKKTWQEYEASAATSRNTLNETKAAANKATETPHTPAPTRAERTTRYAETYEEVRDELVDALSDANGKIRMPRDQAQAVVANLRRALPENLPRSVEGLKQTIRDLMDAATAQARKEGLKNVGHNNLLGDRAHRYTEYLLDLLNLRLSKSRMKIGVFAEQFVAPRKGGKWILNEAEKQRGWILSENRKGWIGIDAVVYENGLVAGAIDLKTGRTWSRSELEIVLQRHGIDINDTKALAELQYEPK